MSRKREHAVDCEMAKRGVWLVKVRSERIVQGFSISISHSVLLGTSLSIRSVGSERWHRCWSIGDTSRCKRKRRCELLRDLCILGNCG